jgi:hypothetical protein
MTNPTIIEDNYMTVITGKILKDTKMTMVAESVKPDSKKRLVLPKNLAREGITYHIYQNSFGQIILDPQVTIPASEVWLFDNPVALGLVREGLSDAAHGRISKIDLDTL